jgi:Na+/melibiose symporter-like transporter
MAEEAKLRKDVPWLMFLAAFSRTMGTNMVTVYLSFYMTERMEISVLLMGSITVAARIIDMITSLLIGVLVQKLRPKHGQYRTWLLYGPFMVAFGTTMCFFNLNVPEFVKGALVLSGWVLMGAGMTFLTLCMNGLQAKIAGPVMANRMALSGKAVQGQTAGTIIASMSIMPLVMFVNAKGVDGYAIIQATMATFGLIFQLPLFLLTREYDSGDYQEGLKSAAAVPSIGAMFGSVMKNGQALWLVLAEIVRWTSSIAMLSIPAYFFTYVARDIGMLAPALTIQSVLGFASSLFAPTLAKKTGKKRAAVLTGLCNALGLTVIALFGMRGAPAWIAGMSIFILSQALMNSLGANLYLDCGEYYLYKTGKDTRTFLISMWGTAAKFGFIFAAVVVTAILSLSGYQAATVPGGAGSVASVSRMAFLCGAIPGAMNLVFALIMMFGYQITEEKSKEYAEHNHKAAQAAAAAD